MPTPRPRYLSRITSPISTAPAAHSPPKPSPCSARNTKSCSKFCAKAQKKVNTEYHRIVICSIRTRPNRSASVPENQPPSDEISNVTVPMSPASPRDRPHSAMTVGMTKLYICTSNASSAQPPKQAPIVRRSLAFNSPNQPSTVSSLGFRRGHRTRHDREFGMEPGFRSDRGLNQIQTPVDAVQPMTDRVSANFECSEANFEA